MVTTFPRDLCLRWVFQDPITGDAKVLYGRDTELRWSEVIAGARSAIVPARYVTRIAPDATLRGPITREWFLDMVSQFSVSKEGKLQRDGLDVAQIWEDFEWMATAMLPTVKDVNLSLYTPERLVKDVREAFHMWHLDSMNLDQLPRPSIPSSVHTSFMTLGLVLLFVLVDGSRRENVTNFIVNIITSTTIRIFWAMLGPNGWLSRPSDAAVVRTVRAALSNRGSWNCPGGIPPIWVIACGPRGNHPHYTIRLFYPHSPLAAFTIHQQQSQHQFFASGSQSLTFAAYNPLFIAQIDL
ncbi:hypothetical protein GGU10DRAFT_337745 [Lentinula aff. detonsa]|uniref:Uncharacterized protein n=1 Tax=Lentinula aff. detonsa TaxID=2804958 RepID=A0AA38NH66_9AGAR|nr:hypothetical protein GGU10DRAFT_337745 [Lentinula aff. detonsa]